MAEQSNNEGKSPSLSILEKFRQLSKEKEQEHCQSNEAKPVKSVGAVYLSNSGSDTPSTNDKRRWNHNRRGGRGGGGNFHGKRKYEGEHSSPPEWKLKRLLERRNTGSHVGLKAEDVGITEYINPHPGFNGIIKQRFSDFQVNEIAEDGKLVRLTSFAVPKDPALSDGDKVSLENDDDMFNILPKKYWDSLYSIVEDEDPTKSVDIEVTDWPKDKRIQVHSAIKNLFREKVVSNTVDIGDKKVLKIFYSKDGGYRAHRRSLWRNKEYLHFVLCKENMDTTEAVNLLAHRLQRRGNNLQYCGTKDKRAVTTQYVSVRRVTADRLHKMQPIRGLTVGNYEYKNYSLKLGQLKGNRFRIAIRNIDASEELLSDLMESLKTKGFLNYFGMQRFGASVIVPTHVIGKALIHRDWKQAVELLLKPRPGERCFPEVAEARKIWWETRDAKKAFKCFHWKATCLEAKVLQGLEKNGPTSYVSALENLPRNLLMFYSHAYQSFIWNKIISRRVKEFGLTPLPGDIVVCKDGGDNSNVNNLTTNDKSDNEEEDDENGDGADSNKIPPDEFIIESSKYGNVKFLTEEDAKTASIEDVVYPLPGYDIDYPKNVVADWYGELLKEDNLSQESLTEAKRYQHLLSMYGVHRKIIEKPDNVTWSVMKYSDENADLCVSDVDKMNGAEPIKSDPDGKYRALVFELDLQSSTYATMALREIMKCETSSSYQASLTKQHQPETSEDTQNNEENQDAVKIKSEIGEGDQNVVDSKPKELEKNSEESLHNGKESSIEKSTSVDDVTVEEESMQTE